MDLFERAYHEVLRRTWNNKNGDQSVPKSVEAFIKKVVENDTTRKRGRAEGFEGIITDFLMKALRAKVADNANDPTKRERARDFVQKLERVELVMPSSEQDASRYSKSLYKAYVKFVNEMKKQHAGSDGKEGHFTQQDEDWFNADFEKRHKDFVLAVRRPRDGTSNSKRTQRQTRSESKQGNEDANGTSGSGEEVVGFVDFIVRRYPNTEEFRHKKGRTNCYLSFLFLDGPYQGCGLGKTICACAEIIATMRNADFFHLFVHPQAPATEMYKKFGYMQLVKPWISLDGGWKRVMHIIAAFQRVYDHNDKKIVDEMDIWDQVTKKDKDVIYYRDPRVPDEQTNHQSFDKYMKRVARGIISLAQMHQNAQQAFALSAAAAGPSSGASPFATHLCLARVVPAQGVALGSTLQLSSVSIDACCASCSRVIVKEQEMGAPLQAQELCHYLERLYYLLDE